MLSSHQSYQAAKTVKLSKLSRCQVVKLLSYQAVKLSIHQVVKLPKLASCQTIKLGTKLSSYQAAKLPGFHTAYVKWANWKIELVTVSTVNGTLYLKFPTWVPQNYPYRVPYYPSEWVYLEKESEFRFGILNNLSIAVELVIWLNFDFGYPRLPHARFFVNISGTSVPNRLKFFLGPRLIYAVLKMAKNQIFEKIFWGVSSWVHPGSLRGNPIDFHKKIEWAKSKDVGTGSKNRQN